jgi:spore germination protein KB
VKKIIISNYQLLLLTAVFVSGASSLIIPNLVASVAGRDLWLSIISAAIVGLLVVWVNIHLAELHPGKSFVEFTMQLLGKWIGGVVAVSLIIIELLAGTDVIWYVGDFFTTVYMTGSSRYYIHILFIAVLVIAVLYGLEVVARAAEVLFVLIFPLYILALLLLIPEYKIDNLLPIAENGAAPIVAGMFPLMNNAVFPIICLSMIFTTNIKNIKAAKKSIFKGYFWGMFELFAGMTVCVLVVGGTLTGKLRYSLFTVTKEINVGVIFSRLEALIVIVWLVASFFAVYIYIYAGILGLSQVLKLKDYKKIVIPLLLIVTVYSGIVYENVPYQLNFDTVVRTPAAVTFGFVLPLVLLIVSLIRKKVGKQQQKGA